MTAKTAGQQVVLDVVTSSCFTVVHHDERLYRHKLHKQDNEPTCAAASGAARRCCQTPRRQLTLAWPKFAPATVAFTMPWTDICLESSSYYQCKKKKKRWKKLYLATRGHKALSTSKMTIEFGCETLLEFRISKFSLLWSQGNRRREGGKYLEALYNTYLFVCISLLSKCYIIHNTD